MRRFLIFTSIFIFIACASNQANKIRKSEVDMSGGTYKRKSWDDTLTFKRTSWYLGANLAYDVLIARLDKTSPFAFWLDNNQDQYATECREFYIALIYTNAMSILHNLETPAAIRNQITNLGFEEVSVSHFQANVRAHGVYGDWHLKSHKTMGFCYKNMSQIPDQIPISLPGFNMQNILHK